MLLQTIDTTLDKLFSRTFISIIAVVLLGLFVRIYFTPWHLPSNSQDAFVFMIEGLSYAKGDFIYFNTRFVWPLFLAVFFTFFKFDDYLGYTTVMRIVSISVSVATVPVLYLIARQFVEKKYAIMTTVFFTIESNLVENSIFAITESMFILLGLISFYFIIQKNEKYFYLAFVFAGLAFDTRLNGVVLFLLLILACIIKIRSKKKLSITLIIGIGIFLTISFPHTIYPLVYNTEFFPSVQHIGNAISENHITISTYDPTQTPISFNIIENALKNEFLHIFRINVPYLIILFPFGIIVALKDLNYQKKILFAAIIISLVIAIPQYTVSNEYRNLFFITPFFCILSAIGIQKITLNIEMKNIFLILLAIGLILLSYNFLRERYDVDQEAVIERDNLGKYIANNFHGRLMGDLQLEIIRNMPNITMDVLFSNQQLAVIAPDFTIDTIPKLMDYATRNKIDYLIMEYKVDERHYPVFQSIFYNEKDSPFLEKIFDSNNNGYKKTLVKIFRINYSKY